MFLIWNILWPANRLNRQKYPNVIILLVGIGIPLMVEKQGTQYYRASGTEEGKKVTISNFTVDPTLLSEANLKDFYAKIERTINGYYNGLN